MNAPFDGAVIQIDLSDPGTITGDGRATYSYVVYGWDRHGQLLSRKDAHGPVWHAEKPQDSIGTEAAPDADVDKLIANLKAAFPGASVYGNYDFDANVSYGDHLTEVVVLDWAAALPPELDPTV